MPKNTDQSDAQSVVDTPHQTEPDAFDLTLQEFCTRLSTSDGRVEMIAGFHYSEIQAGRTKDSEANFSSRYVAFQTQPA